MVSTYPVNLWIHAGLTLGDGLCMRRGNLPARCCASRGRAFLVSAGDATRRNKYTTDGVCVILKAFVYTAMLWVSMSCNNGQLSTLANEQNS